jgi:hypothetical protein
VEPPKRQLMVCCPLSCSLLLDGASTRSAVQCASAHAGTCPCGTGRAGTSDTRMGTAGRAQRIDASEYAHKVRSILEKEYATHPSDQMNTLLAKAILADSAASMAPRRNIQAGSPLEGVIIFLCIMALGELPLRCSTRAAPSRLSSRGRRCLLARLRTPIVRNRCAPLNDACWRHVQAPGCWAGSCSS